MLHHRDPGFGWLAAALVAGAAAPSLAQCVESTAFLSSPAAADAFGASVAMGADVLAVGAPLSSEASAIAGAVRTYARAGLAWVPDLTLTSPTPAESDDYGRSVSIDGDLLAVGAPGDDEAADDSGAVYLYRRTGVLGWSFVAKLAAPDAPAEASLGWSVALSGSVLVAGAPIDSPFGTWSGSVYVFRNGAGGWAFEQKLTEPTGEVFRFFGESVALEGGVLAAGARAVEFTPGVVRAFRHDGAAWQADGELFAPGAEGYAKRVSLSGDTIAVTADEMDPGTGALGGVVVFRNTGPGAWAEEARLFAADPLTDEIAGVSVTIDGDLLATGAVAQDDLGEQRRVLIFRRTGSGWAEVGAAPGSGTVGPGEVFGWQVDATPGRLLVGSLVKSGVGAAYVYDTAACAACYADCEQSTGAGVLDFFDFICFQDFFAAGDPYACDCDESTGPAVCDFFDFICFQDAFSSGC